MAVVRDHPYAQFNFLVDLGTGDIDGPEAGFQECSGISSDDDPAALRTVTIQLQNEDHYGGRDDMDSAPCADRQAYERTVQRKGNRRRDRGNHARVRATRPGMTGRSERFAERQQKADNRQRSQTVSS